MPSSALNSVDFAILKISEGTGWKDPQFEIFYNAAKIPLGASAVLCGNSSNANRCVLIAIRLPNNVGRAFCISAYAALNNIFLSLSSGTWSVNS